MKLFKKPKSLKLLKKRVKELERRLWLVENPPKFKEGDIVKYYPTPTVTVEEEPEYFISEVITNLGVYCNKIKGSYYWYRLYQVRPEDQTNDIEAEETHCVRYKYTRTLKKKNQ